MDNKMIVSAICGLILANYLKNTDLPKYVTAYILPLIVMYISYSTLTLLLPTFNKSSSQYTDFLENKLSQNISNIGYFKIFPVFLLTIIILAILAFQTMKK